LNDVDFQISTLASVTCDSNIVLTQTLTYAGGGSPSTFNFYLPVGLPAGTNYQFASSTGAAAVPGTTLLAGSLVGDVVLPFTLPESFAFSVYGTPLTQLSIKTNSNFLFNTAVGKAEAGNAALPSGPCNTPTLFLLWHDLDMTAINVVGGGIFTTVSGTAPNRSLDIE
jgi:hypothetical protein